MYPKKREKISERHPNVFMRMRALENISFNKCRKEMTQEIKKRADVEKLAGVLVLKTNLSYEEAVNIAQIISTHITEGLENGQLYKKPEKFIADEWREGKQ